MWKLCSVGERTYVKVESIRIYFYLNERWVALITIL